MASTRIYVVTDGMATIGLVRARSQAEAVRHCTAGRFAAKVAEQDVLIEAIGKGMSVETAAAEPETPEAA